MWRKMLEMSCPMLIYPGAITAYIIVMLRIKLFAVLFEYKYDRLNDSYKAITTSPLIRF